MRRIALAAVLCGALELTGLGTVIAIARSAPPASAQVTMSSFVSPRECQQYVVSGTPVLRCRGG